MRNPRPLFTTPSSGRDAKSWLDRVRAIPRFGVGRWSVVRVNDDGRSEPVINGLTEADAHRLAAECRDRCPDSCVEAGWNYLPALPKLAGGFAVKKL